MNRSPNRSRIAARTLVLCAAAHLAFATVDPPLAHAQSARAPATPKTNAPDPTMFSLEGDGAGGPASPPAQAAPAPKGNAPVPTWRDNGSWGWLVVVTSLGLGIATTAYGLTIRCADDATQCRKNTSLAIWGGVGLAAVGSTFGILIVQVGRARVQAKPAVFAADWKASRASLVPGLTLEGTLF